MRQTQEPGFECAGPTGKSAPMPPNDFNEFIQTYYRECRSHAPKIEAIAGKWTFEDLLPGMSDFDARFICTDRMTADDWCRMSMAVGQVHLDLCRARPEWARILEHPPGINLTWNELTDESIYYPEYRQWTFYHCCRPERLKQTRQILARRKWDVKDEYFHLKRFLTYYGPYDRAIDPAINMGLYENRYPLHSRLMHYFTPAVQSAVSILRCEPVTGKMDALEMANELLSPNDIFAEVIETVQQDYEVPQLYKEPALSELETRLHKGLKLVASRLAEAITIFPDAEKTRPEDWTSRLKQVPVAPSLLIFDSAKFSRLMKGRLYFYIHAPSYFDSIWCIQNELKRIGDNFFHVPFSIFWEASRGERIEDPAEIVPQLAPDILTREEVECTLAFHRFTREYRQGHEIETAGQIVDIFDGFFHALHKIGERVMKSQKRKPAR